MGVLVILAALACTAAAPAQQPPATVRLRIIGTNDFHGALEPRPDNTGAMRGGAAALAATIERAEAECAPPACQFILLDGGDEFQGTPASNLAFGRPVTEIFNRLGYTASALGNHEFDWGIDTLRSRIAQAHYAIMAANVHTTDGRLVSWLRRDTLVTRGPFTVGVIGLALVGTPRATRLSNVAGLRFDDPAPVVDTLARELRARGAAAVIVVAHEGAQCVRDVCEGDIVQLARHLTRHVDAIVSGHSHSYLNLTVNGAPIVQARVRGQAIDVVDLIVDPAARTASAPVLQEVREIYTDSIRPDTAIAGMVTRATAAVAAVANRPIVTIADDMLTAPGLQNPLGNLIADDMRAAGHSDFAIMNNGGVRVSLHAGVATFGTLFEIQPFANVLFRVTAPGADMRAYFERMLLGRNPNAHVSGIVITYDSSRAAGHRITKLWLPGGREFSDSARYSVVINDFMLPGGDGLGAPEGSKVEALNIVDLDALIAYLRAQPQPVRAPRDPRLIRAAP
jgi:2',3'-cyclic-nucleotide 2'-phosphodiesterase (5'-nucleotidase family)